MENSDSAPSDNPATKPVMDVAPPPSKDQAATDNPTTKATLPTTPEPEVVPAKADTKPQKPPKPPKQPGNRTGLAIVATIVIVLGLSALATYAFLQTQ